MCLFGTAAGVPLIEVLSPGTAPGEDEREMSAGLAQTVAMDVQFWSILCNWVIEIVPFGCNDFLKRAHRTSLAVRLCRQGPLQ